VDLVLTGHAGIVSLDTMNNASENQPLDRLFNSGGQAGTIPGRLIFGVGFD